MHNIPVDPFGRQTFDSHEIEICIAHGSLKILAYVCAKTTEFCQSV